MFKEYIKKCNDRILDYLFPKRLLDKAVIISCYWNHKNNPYRLRNFNTWYDKIKRYNHRIIELVICEENEAGKPQLLTDNPYIKTVYTYSNLWQKEVLLNKIIKDLPKEYEYVFWVDADVIFERQDWLLESIKVLKENNIMQPFEYCFHLNKEQTPEFFSPELTKYIIQKTNFFNKDNLVNNLWRSFCSNNKTASYCNESGTLVETSSHKDYDIHGHVGFAWGAKRSVLEAVPLYEKALIGGADHIIAHAAAGHLYGNELHNCISKAFHEKEHEEISDWSTKFFEQTKGKIGYLPGVLLHLYHGDLKNREYYKRIKDTSGKYQVEKDSQGCYKPVTKEHEQYVDEYWNKRELNLFNDAFEAETIKQSLNCNTYSEQDDLITENNNNNERNNFS